MGRRGWRIRKKKEIGQYKTNRQGGSGDNAKPREGCGERNSIQFELKKESPLE
jgi:hypothetical protein